ncbi:hypothetical protein PCANC_23487 [Puccinia coronata f. sp. avenae]|uniref:Uncharacterized protein n=1 Tax=Puccinia coronata f. sp. avenae TaxID=200324 RepID=A0A2N5TT70_9BASI|nr:hypothetical protein PCANC_23487 [Puccinia coronata f. sp. avenae]
MSWKKELEIQSLWSPKIQKLQPSKMDPSHANWDAAQSQPQASLSASSQSPETDSNLLNKQVQSALQDAQSAKSSQPTLPALTVEHGSSSSARTAVFARWSDGHCPTKARANWSDRFVRPVLAGPVQPVPRTDWTGLSDLPAGALVGKCLSNHRLNTAVQAPLKLPCLTG